MVRGLNKVQIIGNLGRDPEMRYAPNGDAVTTLNLAANRKYTDQDGQSVKETTWFRVSVWGKQAESCNQFLKKGSLVLVEGRHPTEPDLLGLYEGIALTERDSFYAGALPDTITIYRDALLDICHDEPEVVSEVAITVIHEIAHHFGIEDDRLHELGWG